MFFTIWDLTNSLFACPQSWGSSHVTALLTPALCECLSLVVQIAISVLFFRFCTVQLYSACFDSISLPLISELFSSVCYFQHSSLN